MIELDSKLNIKELAFSEPKLSVGLHPAIDFSRDISFPEDLWRYTQHVSLETMNAVNELDRELGLFYTLEELSELKKINKTWRDYIKRSSDSPITGIGMLLIDCAEKARNEARDINYEEEKLIKHTIHQTANEEEDPDDAANLRIASKYPKLLVWMAEVITFKESTLSLPNYSKPAVKIDVDQQLPIQRRF
jgi:hypothetical protein